MGRVHKIINPFQFVTTTKDCLRCAAARSLFSILLISGYDADANLICVMLRLFGISKCFAAQHSTAETNIYPFSLVVILNDNVDVKVMRLV